MSVTTRSRTSWTFTSCRCGRRTGPSRLSVRDGQAISLADDDPGELTELRRGQFPFKQLRGAPEAAQGIADLVGQLADHAPAGVPLADERVLPVDLAPLGGIGQARRSPGCQGRAAGETWQATSMGVSLLWAAVMLTSWPKISPFDRRTPEQVIHAAEAGQQRLQGAAPAVPGS